MNHFLEQLMLLHFQRDMENMDSDTMVKKSENLARGMVNVRNTLVNNSPMPQAETNNKSLGEKEVTHPLFNMKPPVSGKKNSKTIEKDRSMISDVVALKKQIADKDIEIEILTKKVAFVYAVFEEGKDSFIAKAEDEFFKMQKKAWDALAPLEPS